MITQHQLTPELAFPVSCAETALFVDAAQGGDAGETSCVPVDPRPDARSLTHEFSPAAVLNLARVLYGAVPRGFVLSLMGECFEHGEVLSPEVEKNLPHLLQLVTAFVHETKGCDPESSA
jgi:hydrogenase maturation protease